MGCFVLNLGLFEFGSFSLLTPFMYRKCDRVQLVLFRDVKSVYKMKSFRLFILVVIRDFSRVQNNMLVVMVCNLFQIKTLALISQYLLHELALTI